MENNLSFFRTSSSTNPLVQQQEDKIAAMREDIHMRKNKLKEIDKAIKNSRVQKTAETNENEKKSQD